MRWPWRKRPEGHSEPALVRLEAVREDASDEPCVICSRPISAHTVEQAGYCQLRMRAMVEGAEIRVSDL